MYLENQFKTIHDTLTRIETQTVKTNGKVTDLDKRVMQTEIDLLTHPISCASSKKIEQLGTDLEEYRVMKKYPKIAIYIITFFVVSALYAVYNFADIKGKMREQTVQLRNTINDQEGVSKVTRGNYVKYNDGGLSDSIKLPDIRE